MPNQLACGKRRQSVAEHQAVLAALAEIARHEDTTSAALLREAMRAVVRDRAANSGHREGLCALVMAFSPKAPERIGTAAALARFKRAQREFDQLVLDLGLATPDAVQTRNSVVSSTCRVRVLELEKSHACATTA
jgi:hypothetical protein